jgi:hypothetical protein
MSGKSVSVDQVLAAIHRGDISALPFQAVHIDKRAARRLKKVNAAGEVVGEVDSAEVLAGLLDAQKIRHEELKAKERAEAKVAWDAVRERRKQGIPDHCVDCKKALSMRSASVRYRDRRAFPEFKCRACHPREIEMRRKIREGRASMTPEQRSDATRKGNASKTPEQRSEATRKANAIRTPEQRIESARKAGSIRWQRERSKVSA